MKKPSITIFYQYDPWDSTIGGIQTTVSSFIKYAPPEFELRFVGITSERGRSLHQWHDMELQGRSLKFMPVLYIEDDNRRNLLFPTTLRYTLALLRHRFNSDFMHFHRLEPALATLRAPGDKTFFIHNDIHSQILSQEGGQKNTMLWRYAPQVYGRLERFLLNQFTEILSCNSDSMALYRDRYPEVADRVSLIRNTVDNELFYPLDPEIRDQRRRHQASRLGLSEETQFILFAGRLHPQKDPLLLIHALAELQNPEAHLLIAGEGELRSDVEAEILKLGLASKVTLLGAMKQSQLAALHQLASVCVLTSKFEGLPLVVLEALACGTPIVSTRCGETPKLLSPQSGLLCSDAHPSTVATALDQVLAAPGQYPAPSCLQDAHPYQAKTVIHEVYERMLARWRGRQPTPTAALS